MTLSRLMSNNPLFDGLNAAQLEAVTETLDKPSLVLAGAGSGKTGVLTRRTAHLIQDHGVHPTQIKVVTFTNKAAREMKERIRHYAGDIAANQITMGTFHSIAVRMLRKHGSVIGLSPRFTIFDTDDQKQMIKDALAKHGLSNSADSVRAFLGRISDLKNKLITPQQFSSILAGNAKNEPLDAVTLKVYETYQHLLDKHQAVDFDDLIMKTVQMLDLHKHVRDYYQNRYKYVMVDEYQDTNPAQYKMITLITGQNNLFVVGDDAQSIYAFRGSDLSIILNFEDDYPDCNVVKLEQNYRSTKTIVHAGNMLMKHNVHQKEKLLFTENDNGSKVKVVESKDGLSEAQYVVQEIQNLITYGGRKAKDIAILYRMNFLSQEIEKELNKARIAYNIVGGVNFYERMEIKDLIAYLRVVANPHDDIAMKRVLLNTPGIGRTTLLQIEEFAISMDSSLAIAIKHFLSPRKVVQNALDILRGMLNQLYRLYQLSKSVTDTPVTDILEIVLRSTQYRDNLVAVGDEEALARIQNVDELYKVASLYDKEEDSTLEGFLENAALATSDEEDDTDNQVNLMTVHSSKGLEFPVVFLVGWEEGLFPSKRAISPEDLEEERRLAYVAITRAKEDVYITSAKSRLVFRELQYNKESRFISEIPKEAIIRIKGS